MVEADDRRRFGKPVSLNDDAAALAPEGLELGLERGGADYERPEFPAEHPMDVAIAPPAQQPVLIRGARPSVRLLTRVGTRDIIPQHVQNFRHTHEHRDTPALDLSRADGGVASPHGHPPPPTARPAARRPILAQPMSPPE